MELLEEVRAEKDRVEEERNLKIYDIWTNEEENMVFEKSENVRKSYASRIRFLDNIISMLESSLSDYEFYKLKNKKEV